MNAEMETTTPGSDDDGIDSVAVADLTQVEDHRCP